MSILNELTDDELRDLIITLEKERFTLARRGGISVSDNRLNTTVSTLQKIRIELERRIKQNIG